MKDILLTENNQWNLLRKIFFRFFFVYILLQVMPLGWLSGIPVLEYLSEFYYGALYWMVDLFNKHWFHFPPTNIVNNGSGDTSQQWEEFFTCLALAAVVSIIWGILDRKRKSYNQASYWLRTILRYFVIIACFTYGIDKLFVLQMPFPLQSQLATPLGDFLPMRFSWLFIGYSSPYEIFSGCTEILAGLLLLNRKTITLGLFIGAAVFANVMVLNLCYDIPVKIYSIHLFFYCIFLLESDIKRLFRFFILNRAVEGNTNNLLILPKKWMRITRIVLKLAFIICFVVLPFFNMKDYYQAEKQKKETKPFREGVYDVTVFAVNKDTIPALITDTLRWRDVIFEKAGLGSVGSTDTAFRQRYRRGYFSFVADSAKQTINFKKFAKDSNFIYSFRYDLPDSSTIRLRGKQKTDSVYVILKRSKRHFQLAEKQFHWISEANR